MKTISQRIIEYLNRYPSWISGEDIGTAIRGIQKHATIDRELRRLAHDKLILVDYDYAKNGRRYVIYKMKK